MNNYTLTRIDSKHLCVLAKEATQVFISYDVPVGVFKDGKLLLTNVDWSVTTKRHLSVIRRMYGYDTPTERVGQEVLDEILKSIIGCIRIDDPKETTMGVKATTYPGIVKYEDHINVKTNKYVVPVYRRRSYR